MLRQHQIFQHPINIDLRQSITIDTPDAWKHSFDDPQIDVLPLVDDLQRSYPDGWCTYTYEHVQAPELEIICGGVNAKTHRASAIWRQGNLLHFGFEQSPAVLNENGRALLVNSICYVSRFTEDHPILRTPSAFRPLDRGAIDRLVQNSDRDLETFLDWYLGGDAREAARGMDRDGLAAWYQTARGYLRADEKGKFVIDEEARQFGVAPDSDDFIPTALAGWSQENDPDCLARRLLLRYVAEGPGQSGSIEDWKGWWNENQPHLFFTDTGGFLWKIDPLSKKRGVPTRNLRGVDRATKPPVKLTDTR